MAATGAANSDPFYVRYYSGHQGRHGHEFLEFDFRVLGDGRSASARYANNSNYRNDSLIRKEMCVSSTMIDEIKRIIKTSEILKYVKQRVTGYNTIQHTCADDDTGKTMASGRRRTRMGDKSWRLDWGMTTSRLRQPKSDPSSTSATPPIQKASAFSTISCRTSRHWSSR